MKTIKHQGVRYPVVTVYSKGVLVQMPENECYGMYSRKTIPFEQLTTRQQNIAKKGLKSWQ